MRLSIRLITAALTGLCLNVAQAAIIPGGQLFVVEDNVEIFATFLNGGGAGNTNTLFLVSPSSAGPIFDNHVANPGDTFSLGSFAAGTELVFAIDSDNTSDIFRFFTGPASGNPDNIVHALVDDAFPDVNAPGFTLAAVYFEDIFGGGDLNFGDMGFSLNNVRVVPLPAALILFASGIAGPASARRRQAT